MADAPKRGNFLQLALLFAIIYLGTQFLLRTVFPEQFGPESAKTGLILRPVDATLTIGHHPEFTLENSTENTVTLPDRCPQPPLELFDIQNPDTPQEQAQSISTPSTDTGCATIDPILAGESVHISLAPWKYSLFERVGTYEARVPSEILPAQSGTGVVKSPETNNTAVARFEIREPGAITKLFRTFITAPFLNFLILIASVIPNHDLGLAIILLTLVVKLFLYLPTKKALEGQKKMQILQPKIEALKLQYGNDPQKMQEETMKAWKEHKINPFSACLPTLLQFPILIGLFYVIRDGSHLELSRHLIYPAYLDLPWTFDTFFLGLNLLEPSIYIMPPLLVVLQFIQMKLSFAINERKKAKKGGVIDVGVKEKKPADPQAMQQRIMLYGLPLLIGFFAFQFPAAVSLYWGVSTLFSIGQQILVNREHLRV